MNAENALPATAIVSLAHGVRIRHDSVRDHTVLLAPERTIALDPIAVAILETLDGVRDIDAVSSHLAEIYSSPVDQIRNDVAAFLTEMHNRRFVEVS